MQGCTNFSAKDSFYRTPKLPDICYVSKILTVGSEPVISFSNKGKSISSGLPFCIFVTNKIYVLNETRFLVVRIAIYELFMISSDHCRKAEMG